MKKLIDIIPTDFLETYKIVNYDINYEFINDLNVIFQDCHGFNFSLKLPIYKKFPKKLGLEHAVDKNEYFKFLSNKIHNFKYDYSELDYKNSTTKILIRCKTHGLFEKTPNSHLCRSGCVKCKKEDTKNNKIIEYKNNFIEKSNKIHNNKYDYSLIEYNTARLAIKIICPIHGIFEQIPYVHLASNGCPKCGHCNIGNSLRKTKEIFIKDAISKNGDKYNYDKTEYINAHTKIKIYCKVHNKYFLKSPDLHLQGSGCDLCGKESMAINGTSWNKTRWIKKSKNNKSILYIVKCFNGEEEFYKIGITNKNIKERFRYIPYKYEILYELEYDAEIIWYMEKIIHSSYKKFKYFPIKEFGGDKECYTIEIFKNIKKEDMEEIAKDLVFKKIRDVIKTTSDNQQLGAAIRKIYT